MGRMILACRTLERELNTVMRKLSCTDPVIWLPAGEHNVPAKRRKAIEQALLAVPEADKVLLAMSFCGSTLVGLNSGEKTLLLPCCDDCIGLLLAQPRRKDAYYLTEGWLAGEGNILAEYRASLEKHGVERTKRIFSAMLRGYRTLAYVDTGCGTPEGLTQARKGAQVLGLDFEVVQGTLSRMEALLIEEERADLLRIPPNTTITLDMRKGMQPVTVLPHNKTIFALPGENLLELLRRHRMAPLTPCGGQGSCGKCLVYLDGQLQKSCAIVVDRPMTVAIPEVKALQVLQESTESNAGAVAAVAAVDIGTTSLVCSLLDPATGNRLAVRGAANPQAAYGADVVSRIRAALNGHLDDMTCLIREAVGNLLSGCCADAGIPAEKVEKVCIVGNPAMEQLFLGISPENLVQIPFSPVLTEAKVLPCSDYLPVCPNAKLLVVPNISGYVGGDTVGCIVAEKMGENPGVQLLVDIGTNGEMLIFGENRLVACATAAGPALEGANIRFGMTACAGAIDHLWLENGEIRFSTIENSPPVGICGSGLINAVAAFLELGKINTRGRIAPGLEKDGQRILPICHGIYLTQEDIRQVQLAKGAIQAGIRLMMAELEITAEQIDTCLLAGAFGTYLNPDSACRIGLLPQELAGKIQSIGNSALRGAERMVLEEDLFFQSTTVARNTQVLELASLPEFPKTYAKSMNF